MKSSSIRHQAARILVAFPLLLCTASIATAQGCRGSKIVQSCSNNQAQLQIPCSAYISNPGGTMYQSCMAMAAGQATTTCKPVRVPCDYDETNPLGTLQLLFR